MRRNVLSPMVATVFGVVLFGALASTTANAAYVVTFEEVGPNVEAVGGGSLNLAALQLFDMTSDNAFVFAQGAAELTGAATLTPIDVYVGINGPLSFGPGSSSFGATSGSGGLVGVSGSELDLTVPRDYVSGAPSLRRVGLRQPIVQVAWPHSQRVCLPMGLRSDRGQPDNRDRRRSRTVHLGFDAPRLCGSRLCRPSRLAKGRGRGALGFGATTPTHSGVCACDDAIDGGLAGKAAVSRKSVEKDIAKRALHPILLTIDLNAPT
jgi:hypothetical protein